VSIVEDPMLILPLAIGTAAIVMSIMGYREPSPVKTRKRDYAKMVGASMVFFIAIAIQI